MTDVVIPLRRNLRFQTFWTGSVSATLGQAVGDVAYPLAIVTMTGSPGKAALFSAVQPVLRAAATLIMGVNTVGAGLELVVIVILRHQAVPPYTIGLALGIGFAGGLAGAPLVKLLHRLPPGVPLLAVCGMEVPVLVLLAVPFGPWWAAGVLFTGLLHVPRRLGEEQLRILRARQIQAQPRGVLPADGGIGPPRRRSVLAGQHERRNLSRGLGLDFAELRILLAVVSGDMCEYHDGPPAVAGYSSCR